MGIFQSISEPMAKILKASANATSVLVGARDNIAADRKKIHMLEAANVARSELEQRVATMVSERARQWLNDYGVILLHGEQSPARAAVMNRFEALADESKLMSFGAFCASDPQGAVGLVLSLFEQAGYQPGPAAAVRASELARLRQELAELERSEERAVDEAIAAGLTVAHRPEVVERRQQEERQRQLDEERLQGHRQRQAAVNTSHERRFARSEYLQQK